jgi:hypothetical protein
MRIPKRYFVITLAILSACGHGTVTITAAIPSAYDGDVFITPCVSGQPVVAHIDNKGQGQTSTCIEKGSMVNVFFVRGTTQTQVDPGRVHIEIAGDGVPGGIKISRQ